MDCLSRLVDPSTILVADASVAINLLETKCPSTILDALPNQLVIPKNVVTELEKGQNREPNNIQILGNLIETNRLQVSELGDLGAQYFYNFVGGHGIETLDDGEAATIALAIEINGMPLIDERKANNICKDNFPTLEIGCSVDIFAHKEIESCLGREKLADAVFNALYFGRMRVLPIYLTWVVNLVGAERTAKCCSLPKSVRLTENPPTIQFIT